MMKKRFLAMLLTVMLAAVSAQAELSAPADENEVPDVGEATAVDSGDELYDLVLPMIDARVSEDLTAEEPELGGGYLGLRPVTSQMNDEGDALIIIGDLYQAQAQVYSLSPEEYGNVVWLDRRAVAILRQDASSLLGWALEDVTYDDELQMEDAVARYFEKTMSTWTSADGEVSVQYPAVFGELKADKDADGCEGVSAKLEDGSATFFVGSRANTDTTLSILDESLRQKNPDADITRNDASGVLRVITKSSDGATVTADCYLVTGPAVYHAVMTWSMSLNAEFMRYSDYVMNSFCADELGIG